jgi:IPT/TIG domain
MSTQGPYYDQTTTPADDQSGSPMGPGRNPMGPAAIVGLSVYLVACCLLVLYGFIKLWPHPTPSGEPKAEVSASPSPSPSPTATPAPTATATAPATQTPSPSPIAAAASPSPSPSPSPTPSPSPSPSPSPTPSGKAQLPEPELIYFFNGYLKAYVYSETRLLLLVMLGGALGSLLHSLRSLYWYTGNRQMVWSWAGYYLLLPFTGSMLAVVFYFVIRGGFFSPQASFEFTSPFGFAALSALVGIFSQQAVLKLKEVAETVFTKPQPGADTKQQKTAGSGGAGGAAATPLGPPPTIGTIAPNTGPAAGALPVTITGTGFANGVRVTFGGTLATVTALSPTSLTVTTPAHPAGAVDVVVTNPGGPSVTLLNGFTYT